MELNEVNETDNLRGGTAQKTRQSFKQRMQQVSTDNPPSSNPGGFLAGIFALLCCALPAAGCGLCCLFLIFAVTNALTIATIVIGVIYKEDCPLEKISLLLIVGGSITLVHSLIESITKCITTAKQRDQDQGGNTPASPPGCLTVLLSLLRLASICWFIAACIKIYGVHSSRSSDIHSEDYCHPVLYLFAFWYVTITLGFLVFVLGLTLIIACCACCLACCKS